MNRAEAPAASDPGGTLKPVHLPSFTSTTSAGTSLCWCRACPASLPRPLPRGTELQGLDGAVPLGCGPSKPFLQGVLSLLPELVVWPQEATGPGRAGARKAPWGPGTRDYEGCAGF